LQRLAVTPTGTLPPMDLSGSWRACAADDELRRTGIGLDVDDASWPTLQVPGHWRSSPDFADADGPLLYRKAFHLDQPAEDRRVWVTLDGIFYQADVWLDGAYLGDPEGYFFAHRFDITSLARLSSDHVLAVELSCSPQRDRDAKRNITGVLQDGESFDRTWNPGGLWRPVRIDITGPVRIDRCRVLCRDANDTRAHLRLHARLDSDAPRTARVTTFVDGNAVAQQEHPLALGSNEIAWNLDIAKPQLWWPWSMGDQPLTEVRVQVTVDGAPSDHHVVRTGLREIALEDWVFSVNGERLFAKGVNLAPTSLDLASATPEAMRRDIDLAREAGLDLVRVKGHIARPELYDAADECGMLVWQDFPMHGGHARSVRRQAVEQARAAVDVLGHHPSIAVWCGHDTPEHSLLGQQLPTWNRTILDRWVKRAFEKADETRPVIAHSGVMPHLPQLEGTDTRLHLGWGRGDERDLPGLAAAMPRLVRFVSEFGSQSVPDGDALIDTDTWPDIDWTLLVEHHGLDQQTMDRHIHAAQFTSYDGWRTATQQYQSTLLRHHIETLRRLKYRPVGGFCLLSLADPAPLISTAILDHERRPKLAFASVTDACRTVIVVAERMPARLTAGDSIALDVHVVSDLHHPLDQVDCVATLRWAGGSHRWQWQGDVPADDCVRVGIVRFVVPDAPGEVWLDLALVYGDEAASNRYESIIER
jgi:beta-mannosidase